MSYPALQADYTAAPLNPPYALPPEAAWEEITDLSVNDSAGLGDHKTSAQVVHLARRFHLPAGKRLAVDCRHADASLSVTRLRSPVAGLGLQGRPTLPFEPEDTFLVLVQLTPLAGHRSWRGGRETVAGPCAAGGVSIVHLDQRPRWLIPSAFDMLAVCMPRAALNELSRRYDARLIPALSCPDGRVDEDALRLGACLLPALEQDGGGAFFVEHVILALCTHIAQRYGGLENQPRTRGGLSPRQERLAKEMLLASVQDGRPLREIAAALGLSSGYFLQAFRQSVGETPHRWLTACRLEHAKRLLAESTVPLVEIAMACGFSDQSHLTRVFTQHVGKPPGAWRRGLR
ncbi:AraC family transcriptional regulator [Nitrospirillum sp. BR 11163]|uniref:helix-turn-helix transcriptional regulator n=1 Tax=Nitrospirillum sp. BR 11163 TaxID=3104323 RepID=UPI002AFE2B51|nr:AraC family transcriptional regulator [Nitrospirillum sp. BR 11163]MEA1675844.1 AraC family transcriptional regulator [Nitrospirillum sp. BR 11163]